MREGDGVDRTHLANLRYYGDHCLDKGTELQKAVLWAAATLTAISADERVPPWIKELCTRAAILSATTPGDTDDRS